MVASAGSMGGSMPLLEKPKRKQPPVRPPPQTLHQTTCYHHYMIFVQGNVVPTLNTFRLRSYRVASTPAGSAKLAACDELSSKFGPSIDLGNKREISEFYMMIILPINAGGSLTSRTDVAPVESGEIRAETARPSSKGTGSARKRSGLLKKIDVVRDSSITPRAQGGDVATLECWLNDMLGRSLAKVHPLSTLHNTESMQLIITTLRFPRRRTTRRRRNQ